MEEKEFTFDVARVATFNDAVVAIAITLLVLNVRPEIFAGANNTEVWRGIKQLVPSLIGFAISFWVISQIWIANQQFFKALKRLTMRTLQYNLLLLFIIALLPFPTELIASTHLTQATVGIYAVTVAAASALQAILWHTLHDKNSRHESTSEFTVYFQVLRFSVSAVIFLLSILVAQFSLLAAVLIWIFLGFTRLFNERSAVALKEYEDRFMNRRTRDGK